MQEKFEKMYKLVDPTATDRLDVQRPDVERGKYVKETAGDDVFGAACEIMKTIEGDENISHDIEFNADRSFIGEGSAKFNLDTVEKFTKVMDQGSNGFLTSLGVIHKSIATIMHSWTSRNMIKVDHVLCIMPDAMRDFERLFKDLFPLGMDPELEVHEEDIKEVFAKTSGSEAAIGAREYDYGKDYIAAAEGVTRLMNGLKPQLKTKGDSSSAEKIGKTQVTVYPSPGTSLRPICYGKAIRRKMRRFMRSNLMIDPCMPTDEIIKIFDSWQDHAAKGGNLRLFIKDFDFEKFDRSIIVKMLIIFTLLLVALGVPDDIVLETLMMAYGKDSRDMDGNCMSVWAEVCSGVWSTILGNSFINHAMLFLGGIVQPGESGVTKGDDSHYIGAFPEDMGALVAAMNLNYNMTLKIVSSEVPYFLGHFTLSSEFGSVAIPDPMRLLEKFTSLRPLAQLKEIAQSWYDNRRSFFLDYDEDELRKAVLKKYGVDAVSAIDALKQHLTVALPLIQT
jgi:hypothetical protein